MLRILFLYAFMAVPAFAADKLPPWLESVAASEMPSYDKSVSAVVLIKETRVKVAPNGKVTIFERKAIKILTQEGCDEAMARVSYDSNTGNVRVLEAWVVYPSGEIKKFGKKDVTDVSLSGYALYSETRAKIISKSTEVDPGAVFGYETEFENQSIFTQTSHDFQDNLPVLTSRFILELPFDWTAESVFHNHENIDPEIYNSIYTWQLNNLPPIDEEPARPELSSLVPRICVSYFPNKEGENLGPNFKSWKQVATWAYSLQPQLSKSESVVAAQARKLVIDKTGMLEQIDAIARFVQDIKYVAISMDLSNGGGYIPHESGEVLEKLYGDCKDKANLLRDLLNSIDIKSYPVVVRANDRYYVRENWPSPHQFNHVIIAVEVPREIDSPAVKDHDKLGRLLFFDPTNPYTSLGYLPAEEQDSLGLILSPESDDLVLLPSSSPEENLLTRKIKANLSEEGDLRARVQEECIGNAASKNRKYYIQKTPQEYRRSIESWISRGAPGSQVTNIEANDKGETFWVSVDVNSPRYAKLMGRQLMVFKPAFISPLVDPFFTDDERKYPVILEADAYSESVEVDLPPEFNIDEIPAPVSIKYGFGEYHADWQFEGTRLFFNRSMKINNVTVEQDDYPSVKTFFDQMIAAEQAPVVLVRK